MATAQDSTLTMSPAKIAQGNPSSTALASVKENQNFPATVNGNESRLSVREILTQPLVRKSLPAITAVFIFSILLLIFMWLNGGEYRTLHPNMTEVDRSEAIEVLQASAIPVKIDPGTGTLTVPVERYYDARMALAAAGLPREVSSGAMDYFNEQTSMTTSQFMEEARYTAAIENELAKSITRISTVQSARVHIAAPRQSNFIRNRAPTKASVVVTPFAGRSVSQPQVEAIVNLIASSVPYLATTDVSIVDDRGNLLTTAGKGSLSQANEELSYQQTLEGMYKDRIEALLVPLFGEGSVAAKVDVSMDFTQAESTYEEFDQNGNGPVSRSESIRMEMANNSIAEGVPGGTSNVAPADTELAPVASTVDGESNEAANTNQVRSSQTTRNYELDRTIKYVRNQVGVLNRISVALALDETALKNASAIQIDAEDPNQERDIIQQQIDKTTELVRAAIGFNEARGDMLTVVSSRFHPTESVEASLPWYEQPSLISLIKYGLIALLAMLFMLIVVRPVVKLYMPEKSSDIDMDDEELLGEGDLSAAELAMLSSGDTAGIDEIKAKLRPKKSSISADMLDTANTYDDKVALIRLLVAEDSARVANVLKKLIKPA